MLFVTEEAASSTALVAGPVDEKLIIDGEIEMTTRAPSSDGHPLPEVISGWHYRTESTRALQSDFFENPGMLGVEQGEALWNEVDGTEGKSCASCHNDASVTMAGVGKHQAHGQPVKVNLEDGDMQAWWERGKELYYKRTGQLNLSCASCHEKNNGKYIRADHLSQGNVNGFPTYRLKQGNLISLHNRFRGCIRDTRAEFPAAFSDDLMALEVYTTWRGQGLSVETPAVRQ